MKKNTNVFSSVEPWADCTSSEWNDWKWQLRNALKNLNDFKNHFNLSPDEELGFKGLENLFRAQTTPYYASLMDFENPKCPIRKMIMPVGGELSSPFQQMADPLGENKKDNRPFSRLIHRYTDRALFLITDMCGVYCRYCTRKHFTASDQVLASANQLSEAVNYVREHTEIKELIISGGDPLSVGNNQLEKVIKAFYDIEHLELIRIGSRMPVVCPMRIDDDFIDLLKKYKPIYFMTHFNHPDELTLESAEALEKLVDNGVPVFNQLVLLNGINNDPALIYALSRRLLRLRVKPYYMFQADPSIGTDHLRISIDESLEIQSKLWGHTSGLAMPNYIVDIPDGGGKAALTPNFQIEQKENLRKFKGWDGITANYISPLKETSIKPPVPKKYQQEWLNSH